MKQLFATVFCLVISITAVFAAPVDSAITRRVAVNFYSNKVSRLLDSRYTNVTIAQVARASNTSRGGEVTECYRIYNIGNGFVIVSADDRARPILGYSTEGRFSPTDIPAQLDDILNFYKESILSAINDPSPAGSQIENMWRALTAEDYRPTREGTPVVGPLLNTNWNQDILYNNLCPTDNRGPGGHVYAGCVATAMAQIIRYWQYPTHGIGSHSYMADYANEGYGNYGFQSVNFEDATYDYTNMPATLSSSSTAAQINEVAKLIYHCGVSVNMEYGYNGSGAVSSNSANAFNNYFGYSGCYHKNRSSYTNDSWANLLKTELNNAQPILYHGSGTGSHAFVCDGYDSQDYFHFNFGWSGSYNGYYLISNINPGVNNLSYSQGAVLGITANTPIIRPSTNTLTFITEANTVSEGRRVSIITNILPSPISVTVSGNFKISADSIHYLTSTTISRYGGHFFVHHQPSDDEATDYGFICLSSGDIRDTIFLTGHVYVNSCLPPEALSIYSQDLEHVNLQWEAPILDPDPQTLSWSDNI